MSDPVFPTLTFTNGGEDSKLYRMQQEDPTLKTEMEGGYVVSRARHTRIPRKTFSTGYTGISDADKKILENFYAQVRGASMIFDWIDPVGGTVYKVRFDGPIEFRYVGIGPTKLWDIQFKVVQA